MGVHRWAIVGTGAIATRMATDLQHPDAGATHVATLSREQERAGRFNGRLRSNAGAFADVDRLVAQARPSIAYIATPHPQHASHARAFLERGVPVLVEKPMTCSQEETAMLLDTAREHDVYIAEAMWTRFNPVVRHLREELQDGAIGEVLSISTGQGFAIPFDERTRVWNPELAGGATLDMACYAFALAVMILGPVAVETVHTRFAANGVDAQSAVTYSARDGRASGAAEWSFLRRISAPARILGTEGTAVLAPPFQRTTGLRIRGRRRKGLAHPLVGEGFVPMIVRVGGEISRGARESACMSHADSLAVAAATDAVLRENLRQRREDPEH